MQNEPINGNGRRNCVYDKLPVYSNMLHRIASTESESESTETFLFKLNECLSPSSLLLVPLYARFHMCVLCINAVTVFWFFFLFFLALSLALSLVLLQFAFENDVM